MGISLYGRRAEGGVRTPASPSQALREELGLLRLSLGELCDELADIIREFANIKFDVISRRRA